ncbi:hypothetical protein PMIN06_006281 [Paraphaeosphaeria minitans]
MHAWGHSCRPTLSTTLALRAKARTPTTFQVAILRCAIAGQSQLLTTKSRASGRNAESVQSREAGRDFAGRICIWVVEGPLARTSEKDLDAFSCNSGVYSYTETSVQKGDHVHDHLFDCCRANGWQAIAPISMHADVFERGNIGCSSETTWSVVESILRGRSTNARISSTCISVVDEGLILEIDFAQVR